MFVYIHIIHIYRCMYMSIYTYIYTHVYIYIYVRVCIWWKPESWNVSTEAN